MEKIDYKKTLKHLYAPSTKTPEIIEVPDMNFLMIDGEGNPNTSTAYKQAVEALYGLAYTIKFAVKKGEAIDYSVFPLEGLWWADDMNAFILGERDDWRWTMMIAQPEFVTPVHVETAIAEARRKKELPALDMVRFQPYAEGLSAQLMHLGPYTAEGPTIQKLHQFITDQGCALRGLHHEIYLGDPRRTAPEKLKTVLRQPVQKPA